MSIRDLLNAEPDRSQWSAIKSLEIAKALPRLARTQRAKGLEVELVEVRGAGGGLLEVLARAWQDGQQIGFGRDGSVDIERFRIINAPIMVADPLGLYLRIWDDDGVLRSKSYREDPQEALLQEIEHTISVKKQKFPGSRNIVLGKIGRTTLTAHPVAGTGTAPVDGNMNRGGVNETFATIHGGAGTDAFDSLATARIRLDGSTTTNQFKLLVRMVAGFDTSSIGADNIDSAILSIKSNAKDSNLGANEIGVTSFSPAAENSLTASDYNIANHGSTDFATRISTAAWDAGGTTYNDFTLNASGEGHINKSGNTFFSARLGWDIDVSFTGTWASNARTSFNSDMADTTGTTDDPKLVVEHTPSSQTIDLVVASDGVDFSPKSLSLAEDIRLSVREFSFAAGSLLLSLFTSLSSAVLSFSAGAVSLAAVLRLGTKTFSFLARAITVSGLAAAGRWLVEQMRRRRRH